MKRQTITRDDDSRGLVGPRRLRRRRRRQLCAAHGRSDQQRRRLYGTRAGDGGRAGLRGQSLEQHPQPEPLRSVPQRDDAGADAELRAQRQCEPRLRAGQYGGQPRAALDLRNGGEGERRAQLLARRSERLRPDLDHVDQQLGECHGRRIGDAGPAGGSAGAIGGTEPELLIHRRGPGRVSDDDLQQHHQPVVFQVS